MKSGLFPLVPIIKLLLIGTKASEGLLPISITSCLIDVGKRRWIKNTLAGLKNALISSPRKRRCSYVKYYNYLMISDVIKLDYLIQVVFTSSSI